jgi:hypothetical protein
MRNLKYTAYQPEPRLLDPKQRVLDYLKRAKLNKVTRLSVAKHCNITVHTASRVNLTRLIDQERARRYEAREYYGKADMLRQLGYERGNFATFDDWHLRWYGKRWTDVYLVSNCTQDDIRAIAALRESGMNLTAVAEKSGYSYAACKRFLGVYDRFGAKVFVPREMAS